MNRIILLTIALLGFYTQLSAQDSEPKFSGGGEGTYEKPYIIMTAEQLNEVRNHLDKRFRIDVDEIDLTEWIEKHAKDAGWMPIGTEDKPFTGYLEGNKKKIKGLWIDRPTTNYVGLFGVINDGQVWNLSIEGGEIKGQNYVGCLVGHMDKGKVAISECEANVSGKNYVGGFAGRVSGPMDNCYAKGSVEGTGSHIGGFTGSLNYATIERCYSTADVEATGNEAEYVGGFCGAQEYNNSYWCSIENCYSTGSVTVNLASTKNSLGSFIGFNEGNVNFCYTLSPIQATNKSGFVGINNGDIRGSYFDTSKTGTKQNCLEKGDNNKVLQAFASSTSEMINKATFSGWKFEIESGHRGNEVPWLIGYNGQTTYPYLWWQLSDFPIVEESQTYPTYHTVTLTVEAGIGCDYQAGKLTLGDGDHLYLQFWGESPAITAIDVLFLVDGVETTIKDSGTGRFGYILNPVHGDHTLLVALKEYTITVPEVEGARMMPEAGTHAIAYGSEFRFSLLPDFEQNPEDIKVYANGTLLDRAPETKFALSRSSTTTATYNYVIDRVTGPITITVEGVNPVSNEQIAQGKVAIAVENGLLKVESSLATPADVTVFDLYGRIIATCRVNTQQTIPLSPGIYLVKVPGTVHKIIIP